MGPIWVYRPPVEGSVHPDRPHLGDSHNFDLLNVTKLAHMSCCLAERGEKAQNRRADMVLHSGSS